jgi:hypothetical protein
MIEKNMEIYKNLKEWSDKNDDGNQLIIAYFDFAQIDITSLDFCYPTNLESLRQMFLMHDVVFTESFNDFQDEILALQKQLQNDVYLMEERYQDLYVPETGKPLYNYTDRTFVVETIVNNFDVIVANTRQIISMLKYSDLLLLYNTILFTQGKISKTEMSIYSMLTEATDSPTKIKTLVPKIKQIQPSKE